MDRTAAIRDGARFGDPGAFSDGISRARLRGQNEHRRWSRWDHPPMPTTCEACGGRCDQIPAGGTVLRCPHCMHARPFVRPPLLVVVGPMGVGKSTICSRLAGTLPGAVLLDADIFGYQHVKVVGGDPDYTAFWRWMIEVAHEIAQNNLVVTYFSVMLPEQILANVDALEYFDSVQFLYLQASDRVLRERIARQAGTIASGVDIDAYLDDRTREWSTFNGVLDRAATSTPATTVIDATRSAGEVEQDVREWISTHLDGLSPAAP